MAFDLSEINYRTVADPEGFIAECDAEYAAKIARAADMISANRKRAPSSCSPAPAARGKTTTAQKIEEELSRRGIRSYTISLDNYFRTVDPATSPRTADGGYDFESPKCLDMELLNEHFTPLAQRRAHLRAEVRVLAADARRGAEQVAEARAATRSPSSRASTRSTTR